MNGLLAEKAAQADSLLARLDDSTRLLHEVEQTLRTASADAKVLEDERVKADVVRSALRAGSEQAERALFFADKRLLALGDLSKTVEEALGRATDILTRLSEKADRVDASTVRLDEYVEKLNKVQDLYNAVNGLGEQLRVDVAMLLDRVGQLDHDLRHERSERLQDNAKTQRQFREVMKHG